LEILQGGRQGTGKGAQVLDQEWAKRSRRLSREWGGGVKADCINKGRKCSGGVLHLGHVRKLRGGEKEKKKSSAEG